MTNKTKFIIFIFLFLSTYLISITSVLYTESFILFFAILLICIYTFNNNILKNKYNKEDIKWNETILFYLTMKNWHRSLIRDTNIKIANFLLLSIQIQKYEIEWLKRNLNNIVKRDHINLTNSTLKRLEILSGFKHTMKTQSRVSGLRRLNIIPQPVIGWHEELTDSEKKLKKYHFLYYTVIYKPRKNKNNDTSANLAYLVMNDDPSTNEESGFVEDSKNKTT